MAKNRGIRIRISAQRVAALAEICEEMLEEFQPTGDHHQLLREYMLELHDKLGEMARRNQEMYTLHLVGSEAIAFYQLWHMLDISRDKYAILIVDNLMKKMSALAA
jgi:hypothetical protein